MNTKIKSRCLFILAMMAFSTSLKAQTLKSGIYGPNPDADVTTYAELINNVLVTRYAGKYESKYIKKTENSFVSENGKSNVIIESNSSYKITNSEGNSTVMSLLLDMPKLDKKDLQAIDLPTGKGFITQKLPFSIAGNYTFDGSANVVTQFNADGTGKFQYAIDADRAGQLFDVKWGILCNDAGQQLAGYRNGVSSYTLMIYTTKWEAIGLQYAKKAGKIVINRDRFKNN